MDGVEGSATAGQKRSAGRLCILPAVAILACAAMGALLTHLPPDYWLGRGVRPGVAGPAPEGRPYQMQDFAFFFNYSRYAAGLRGESPYSTEAQLRFSDEWLGERLTGAFCFGSAPSALVVLGPLFPLKTKLAWLAWSVGGGLLIVHGLWRILGEGAGRIAWVRLWCVAPPTLMAILQGQTCLVTTGLLLWMLPSQRSGPQEPRRWIPEWACQGAVLLVLSMKPPLGLAFGAALFGSRRLAGLAAGTCAVLAVVGGVTCLWGPGWARDYTAMLSTYDTVAAPEIFRRVLHPEDMSNLRHMLLLLPGWDDGASSRVSSLCFLAWLAVIAAGPWALRRNVPLGTAVSAAILGYVLLAPHLNPYEDIAVLIPAAMAAGAADGSARALLVRGGALGVLLLGGGTAWALWRLNPAVAAALPCIAIGFASKVLLAAGIGCPAGAASAARKPEGFRP